MYASVPLAFYYLASLADWKQFVPHQTYNVVEAQVAMLFNVGEETSCNQLLIDTAT